MPGSKSPKSRKGKSPRTPNRRMTEFDEDRKAKAKEMAAEKGLLWTKDVPKESKNYEFVKRDDSHLAQKEIGFLDIGKAEPTHAYDVGGDWKLLYKKPGADGIDLPAGPGIMPRTSPKASPKPKKNRLAPEMKIYIRKWDGTRLCLENVKADDTIDSIQKRIQDEHFIPREHQRLRFGSRPLDKPRETLKDCGIVDCATLDLDPMKIYVRQPYRNKKHTLNVSPFDTIDQIKDKVEEKTGVPKKHQILNFEGQPLDKESKTLENYGIEHEDTLDLQPMEIKVRAPDGRVCDLIVDPEDTVNDVKKQVKKKLGIPAKDQRPTFNGDPLPDNSTLDDNDIHHGDVIDLTPMQIKVRAPDGETCILTVEPDDTIPEIKKQVEEKLGIPPKDQRPTFDGKPLPDNSTLEDNNIGHGDLIDLSPMKIRVRAPDGRTCELNVHPEDTIPAIKKQVKKKLGIPTKQQRPTFKNKPLPDDSNLSDNDIKHGDVIDLQPMQIQVRAPDGQICNLNVNPEDTIPDIKNQVEKKLGIPAEDQRPIFNDRPLPDNSSLEDNGIQDGDVIDLEPMEIRVKASDGRKIQLPVTPDDTIEDIKKRVKKQLGIPTEDQRPRFNNNPLADDSTLRDNGIRHGDTINLDPMEIKVVAPDGRTTELMVIPDYTIDDIKDRVEKNLGIAPEDQRPEFHGKPLNDGTSTLRDNNIRHGDTIHLQPMEIQVKAPDGRIADLVVNPDDTIDDVKKKVKKQLGIPTKDQRPTFNDEPLPRKSTLKDNNIRHGDMIELQPMEIYVIDLDGRKGTYEVISSDTVGEIKSRVADKTGVIPKDQRLVFETNLLVDNDKTLSDVDIEHQDTLKLEPFRVHVRLPGGKKVTLDVNPRITTAMDVKNMMNQREGIIPKDQILKFKGNELIDQVTLGDNGIVHDDILDLRMTTPPPKAASPVIKKDYLKALDPDRYGKVTVTSYKTRYDGEPGESFIDGEGKREVTDFKFEKPIRSSEQ
jgi:hypothetical protein